MYLRMQLRGNIIAKTKGGRLANVSKHLGPNDMIAIIYGCKTPFLIRPSTAGHYHLNGECYVHGLMLGEALHNDLGIEQVFYLD